MNDQDMQALGVKLEESGNLEGSENGEYWCHLASMISYHWLMSDEFQSAFETELKASAKFIDENYVLKEETRPETIVVRSLIYTGE